MHLRGGGGKERGVPGGVALCVYSLKKTAQVLSQAGNSSSADLCYLPQHRRWTEGFPSCRSRAHATSTYLWMQMALWDTEREDRCPVSCRVPEFRLESRWRILSGESTAQSSLNKLKESFVFFYEHATLYYCGVLPSYKPEFPFFDPHLSLLKQATPAPPSRP